MLWALTGCDRLADLTLSAEAKRLKAFPASAAQVAARQALAASMSGTGAQRHVFDVGVDSAMARRAQRCSAGQAVGVLTSVAHLRRAATDPVACGADDPNLQSWLKQHEVALRLSLPPVYPMQPLGPLRASTLVRGALLTHAVFAAAADVALLADASGTYHLIRASSGTAMDSVSGEVMADRPPLLAPNGRLAALPVGTTDWRVVELDSLREIWTFSGLSRLLAWLPAEGALIGLDAIDQKGVLFDLWSGQRTPHAEAHGVTWAWPDGANSHDVWLWREGKVLGVRHERIGDAVGVRQVQGVGLAGVAEVKGSPPVLLAQRWWVGQGSFNYLGLVDVRAPNSAVQRQMVALPWDGPAILEEQLAVLLVQSQPMATLVVLDLVGGQARSMQAPATGPLRLSALVGRPGVLLRGEGAFWVGGQLAGLKEAAPVLAWQDWLADQQRQLAEALPPPR